MESIKQNIDLAYVVYIHKDCHKDIFTAFLLSRVQNWSKSCIRRRKWSTGRISIWSKFPIIGEKSKSKYAYVSLSWLKIVTVTKFTDKNPASLGSPSILSCEFAILTFFSFFLRRWTLNIYHFVPCINEILVVKGLFGEVGNNIINLIRFLAKIRTRSVEGRRRY